MVNTYYKMDVASGTNVFVRANDKATVVVRSGASVYLDAASIFTGFILLVQ